MFAIAKNTMLAGQALLVGLRVFGVIDWEWRVVLLPIEILAALAVIGFLIHWGHCNFRR